jgi:uncharacterized coiled-coil protein SlyX
MKNNEDVATTILSQITDALEEHNKILLAHRTYIERHQKHLERLSGEVAEITNKVKDLEAAESLDSSDAKFIAGVSARLKAISNAIDAKP